MKLLAIDTATEACSAAILVDERIAGRFDVCPQQHSQRILPMIDDLLAENQLTLNEFDALVFGRGPGSFTGVRIAMGVLQGLALGTGLPVMGVSTMAAMAQQAHEKTGASDVVAAIDARMDEVYYAHYRAEDGLMVLVGEEQVLSPEYAVKGLPSGAFVAVGTGWQAYPSLGDKLGTQALPQVLYPDAQYMLHLGRQGIENGDQTDIDDAQPVYLRDKVTWKKLPGR